MGPTPVVAERLLRLRLTLVAHARQFLCMWWNYQATGSLLPGWFCCRLLQPLIASILSLSYSFSIPSLSSAATFTQTGDLLNPTRAVVYPPNYLVVRVLHAMSFHIDRTAFDRARAKVHTSLDWVVWVLCAHQLNDADNILWHLSIKWWLLRANSQLALLVQ